jgi:hypothetical protein
VRIRPDLGSVAHGGDSGWQGNSRYTGRR